MPVPSKIADHVQQGLDLLLSQYGRSSRLRELVSILLTEVQRAEDVAYDVLTGRTLASAATAALERIGRLVGLARLDTDTDDEYRELLGAAIAAQESPGDTETVARVAASCAGEDVHAYWGGPAHLHIDYTTDSGMSDRHAERSAELIERALPAGVSCTVVEGSGSTTAFRLGSSRLGSHRLGRVVIDIRS